MGRQRHGKITADCPEVIGVLNYLHEKGTEYGLDLTGYDADALEVLALLQTEKKLGDPTAIMAEETVEIDLDSDDFFYLTNAPDML